MKTSMRLPDLLATSLLWVLFAGNLITLVVLMFTSRWDWLISYIALAVSAEMLNDMYSKEDEWPYPTTSR